jgi:hypothetical protein
MKKRYYIVLIIFFVTSIILFLNAYQISFISDFSDRILSQTAQHNIDISKVVMTYYIFITALVLSILNMFKYKSAWIIQGTIRLYTFVGKYINRAIDKTNIFLITFIGISAGAITSELLLFPTRSQETPAFDYINFLVHNYRIKILVCAILALLSMIGTLLYLRKSKKLYENGKEQINFLCFFGSILTFYGLLVKYLSSSGISLVFISGSILFACTFILKQASLYKKVGIYEYPDIVIMKDMCFCIILAFSFISFVSIITRTFFSNISSCYIYFISFVGFIMFFNFLGALYYFIHKDLSYSLLLPLSIYLCISCIFIEITYTLHTHNINFTGISSILVIFMITAYIIIFILAKKRKSIKVSDETVNIVSLLGILSITFMRSFHDIITFNLFEGANHGISIKAFDIFKEIPLVHNFDAHMLSQTGLGIVYGLINNDNIGALVSPYKYVFCIIIYLSIFYILKSFFQNSYAALIITLLIPQQYFIGVNIVNSNFAFQFFMAGIMLVAFFLYWNKKASMLRDALLWFFAAASILYSLDTGVSFGVALVICASVKLCIEKSWSKLARLWMIGTLIGFIFFTLLIYLLHRADINLSLWLKTFMNSVSSNQNWAYANLGSTIQVILAYIMMPAVIGIVCRAFLQRRQSNPKWDHNQYVILMLIIAWLFNVPRIIIRHSIVEMNYIIISYVVIVIIMLSYNYFPRNKLLLSMISMYIVVGIIYPTFIQSAGASVYFTYLQNEENMLRTITNIASVEHSYVLNEEQEKTVRYLSEFWNAYMKPEDTYIDFTNDTMLYALTDRNNPVYVNQSPGLVNGEIGQILFLKQIEEYQNQIPFVLMPYMKGALYQLDGVQNTDRYYLITEFIGNHYKPLCAIDGYAIWCTKEKYDEISSDVGKSGKHEMLGNYHYGKDDFYIHELGEIPYLWANYDGISIEDIEFQLELELSSEGSCQINYDKIDITGGNYLVLKINSPTNSTGMLTLSGNTEKAVVYHFNLKNGINFYKIRISSDIQWYSEKLDHLKISAIPDIQVEEAYIGTGDILETIN